MLVTSLGGRAQLVSSANVASFRSGNNTAPMGRDDLDGQNDVVAVKSLADFPELNQLPDRDVFSITPQPDRLTSCLAKIYGTASIESSTDSRRGEDHCCLCDFRGLCV